MSKDENWEKFEIMVARDEFSHSNELDPDKFKHEATLSVIGERGIFLAEEICNLLNENKSYDCIWKFRVKEK